MKDGHHIIHPRQEYSLRPEARALRENFQTLIPRIERSEHNETHANCPAIPLLGHQALLRTLAHFQEGDTTLQSMDNLMNSMEFAAKHPKAHEVEKRLAELAVWAVDLQKPYMAYATDSRRLHIV